jgi:hypothetical protein
MPNPMHCTLHPKKIPLLLLCGNPRPRPPYVSCYLSLYYVTHTFNSTHT